MYAAPSRLSAYLALIPVAGALVRPARTRALQRILLVGDQRVGGAFWMPFGALCRDHRCELVVYLKEDWVRRLPDLVGQHRPDATVVVTAQDDCVDILVRAKSSASQVVHVCPATTSPASLAAASAQAWVMAQQPQ